MLHEPELKRVRLSTIVMAIVSLVVFIILCARPDILKAKLAGVLGIGLMLFGIWRILVYVFRDRKSSLIAGNLFLGAFAVINSVFFQFCQQAIQQHLILILCALLLGGCMIKVQNALDLYAMRDLNWWICLILAGVSAAMSLLLYLKQDWVLEKAFIVAGLFLLYDSLSDIASVILFQLRFRMIKNAVKTGIPVAPPKPRAPKQPNPKHDLFGVFAQNDPAAAADDAQPVEEDLFRSAERKPAAPVPEVMPAAEELYAGAAPSYDAEFESAAPEAEEQYDGAAPADEALSPDADPADDAVFESVAPEYDAAADDFEEEEDEEEEEEEEEVPKKEKKGFFFFRKKEKKEAEPEEDEQPARTGFDLSDEPVHVGFDVYDEKEAAPPADAEYSELEDDEASYDAGASDEEPAGYSDTDSFDEAVFETNGEPDEDDDTKDEFEVSDSDDEIDSEFDVKEEEVSETYDEPVYDSYADLRETYEETDPVLSELPEGQNDTSYEDIPMDVSPAPWDTSASQPAMNFDPETGEPLN